MISVCFKARLMRMRRLSVKFAIIMEQGIPYHEMAVLFRTNTQAENAAGEDDGV